jgi:hypothetical protein
LPFPNFSFGYFRIEGSSSHDGIDFITPYSFKEVSEHALSSLRWVIMGSIAALMRYCLLLFFEIERFVIYLFLNKALLLSYAQGLTFRSSPYLQSHNQMASLYFFMTYFSTVANVWLSCGLPKK